MNAPHPLRRTAPALVAVVALVASCSTSTTSGATDTGTVAPPTRIAASDFPSMRFSSPTVVDNRWFPLTPGMRWTYEGHALDGRERLHRRVEITVTDLTKQMDGVTVVVVRELDYTDGALEESELSFFAQDDGGTVWHLGEYPEEYEDGRLVKHPVWIAGADGALPGIHMPADPALDTPSYSQGWGPAVGWDDRGDTYAVGQRTCTPVDCYDGVMVAREFSRSEPGAYQLKYYAPGIGNVRVGWGGPNESEHEVLVLTERRRLVGDELAAVRAKAIAQDERGYGLSLDVYGTTTPATRSAA